MMIVVAPTVTEEGLPAVVERVSGLIEAQDGEIESFTHDSPWGHRRLAYPIQNFRDAFYVLYYFHAAPRAISELDRELRLDSTIIRHLVVKFDPLAHREIDTGPDGEEPVEESVEEEAADSAGEPATEAEAPAPADDNDDGDEAAEVEAEAADESDVPEPDAEANEADNGEDDDEE